MEGRTPGALARATRRMEIQLTEMGTGLGGTDLRREVRFSHVKFEMVIRHPTAMSNEKLNIRAQR